MPASTKNNLTRNQGLVLSELSKASAPLSAYTLLDNLRCEGLRAPLQIYRALDKLVEFGFVHRIESLNAFVACRHGHDGCESPKSASFMICDECGNVSELSDDKLTRCLAALCRDKQFAPESTNIELHGLCVSCQAS